jgi:hypothetical protein
MKKDEIVKKNISLTFDFMRNIVDNPDILSAIPDGSEVDFIETDLPRYIVVKNRVEDAVEPVVFRVEHTFHGIVAEK